MSKNQEVLNNKLMQAIWNKNFEEAEAAIAEGAEINPKDSSVTPLTHKLLIHKILILLKNLY